LVILNLIQRSRGKYCKESRKGGNGDRGGLDWLLAKNFSRGGMVRQRENEIFKKRKKQQTEEDGDSKGLEKSREVTESPH